MIQSQFSQLKYPINPNVKLFPMTKYYDEFNNFLDKQIQLVALETKVESNLEIFEKTKQVSQLLWRYDLRRSFNTDLYFKQIIKNVFNSLHSNQPVTLIQFACTKRGLQTDQNKVESSIITSAEGSNLLPNLPFLKVIKQELTDLNIESQIIVLFADSENYWVDFIQGKNVDYDLITNLKPIWKQASQNLINTTSEILGDENTINIIPTSQLEDQLQTDFRISFEEIFDKNLQSLYTKFPLKLLMRMALVWKNVALGNQRNAFSDAEEEISSQKFAEIEQWDLNNLKDFIEPIYLDKAARQLTEYPLQGWMLEQFYPNGILLQNERPFGTKQYDFKDGKNYFYNVDLSLRTKLLPEIAPYFYV